MRSWKTLARSTILSHNKFLNVENHVVKLPDGRIIDDWAWVITPDFVNVIPVTEDGKIICFRQYKYAVGGITLAPVGGYINDGEDPIIAAKRELLEETGFQAGEWVYLGDFNLMANRGGGVGYTYLAMGAHHVTTPNSDDLEDQELMFLDQEAVKRALVQGEFKVFPWATTVALALMHLDKH